MQETSPTSQTSNDLNTSSPTLNSSSPVSAEEAPLAFLTPKPCHLMSDEELTAKVSEWRTKRDSVQTLRASMLKEAEEEEEASEVKKGKRRSKVDDLLDSLT